MGANGRVNLGVIGCGRAGINHIICLQDIKKEKEADVEVAAVCDIYEPRKSEAKKLSGGKLFHDYREMLEMGELDGVIIATPDHWHGRMCVDAMEAGKDVYCEEPMTLRWEDAKAVKRVADRTLRVVQVGAAVCSDERWLKARELIEGGKLGKIVWSQASIARNSEDGDADDVEIEPTASPDNLDWERFLGPAPWSPFDRERFFRHSKYWDYSAGWPSDPLSCGLYGLQASLGPELPRRVVAAGGHFVHEDREVPGTFHLIADYPSEQTIVIACCVTNEQGLPAVIRGKEATMFFDRDRITVRPQRIYVEDHDPVKMPLRIAADPLKEHLKNFLACMRTRSRPNCDVDLAYKVTVTLALGVLSYREKKVAFFDPEKEEVI